jgi:hypothetical protein
MKVEQETNRLRAMRPRSVATLLRMGDALVIEIGSRFEPPRSDLVRVADRARIDFGGNGVPNWLLSPGPDVPPQVLNSRIEPGRSGRGQAYRTDQLATSP